MKCRYCADTLRVVNEKLFSSLGERCAASPQGVHVAVTDGERCVYCGNEVRSQNGKPLTKRHCLQEIPHRHALPAIACARRRCAVH